MVVRLSALSADLPLPPGRFLVLISVRGCVDRRAIVRLEGQEAIGDHQFEFRCNRSTTDQTFYIPWIQEKKLQYNETVCQLWTDFKEAYDSTRRTALYSILNESGINLKGITLIKTCLNEACSKVRVGKYLTHSGLKRGDCVISAVQLLFRIRHQEGPGNQDGLNLNGTPQHVLCWWCNYSGG
jgi:hypothetical protein